MVKSISRVPVVWSVRICVATAVRLTLNRARSTVPITAKLKYGIFGPPFGLVATLCPTSRPRKKMNTRVAKVSMSEKKKGVR